MGLPGSLVNGVELGILKIANYKDSWIYDKKFIFRTSIVRLLKDHISRIFQNLFFYIVSSKIDRSGSTVGDFSSGICTNATCGKEIFSFCLGLTWDTGNLDELRGYHLTRILNVTREIDN